MGQSSAVHLGEDNLHRSYQPEKREEQRHPNPHPIHRVSPATQTHTREQMHPLAAKGNGQERAGVARLTSKMPTLQGTAGNIIVPHSTCGGWLLSALQIGQVQVYHHKSTVFQQNLQVTLQTPLEVA